MNLVVAGLLIAAPLAVWFAVYGLAVLATRPIRITPAPAAEDLGPEPPAVASVCVNHWEVTEDAAESTLLDLGARHILEFRQPSNDPVQTTVHVREPNPAGLNAYERRVFDRVAGLAVGGVVPLTALTFRNAAEATAWSKRLSADVMTEVVGRGLARKRFGPRLVGLLVLFAFVMAVAVTAAVAYVIHVRSPRTSISSVWIAGVFSFTILSSFAARDHGYRELPAGVEVAARWLGVRAWLRGHEAFGDLPPSAVAVWDRYLSYGAAVGSTRVASAVIDLGMGNRKRVWSSYGGSPDQPAWHRIRVHYPRFWRRYGRTNGRLITKGLLRIAFGAALIVFWYRLIDAASSNLFHAATTTVVKTVKGKRTTLTTRTHGNILDIASTVKTVGLAIGVALVIYGLYLLVRAIVDAVTPVTVTGEVVWTEVWRSGGGGENTPAHPVLYYLAVDDGSGDSTRAWAALPAMCRRCTHGDVVTIRAHRWSRRVDDLTVVREGGHRHLQQTELSASLLPYPRVLGGPGPYDQVEPLVTADEVGRALGFPVTVRGVFPPGRMPVQVTEFRAPDGTTALTVMRGRGMMTRITMRARRNQGQPVPGLGDEAHGGPGWLMARRGDEVVMAHLAGPGTAMPPAHLAGLVNTAIGRIPTQATPA